MFQNHIMAAKKLPCEIVAVNPSADTQSKVQGVTRVGPVHIAVFTTDPFFRWPVVGENWIIKEENGTWYLDTILQNKKDAKLIHDLNPGEGHINVMGRIQTSRNTIVTQKYTQVVGDGAKKEWEIPHHLDDFAIQVSVINTTTKVSITAFTWAPATKSSKPDPNNLIINFTSAPAAKGAEVVVIG